MTKIAYLALCLCCLSYLTVVSTDFLAKKSTYEICGGGFDGVCTTLTISENAWLDKFNLYVNDTKLIEARLSSFDHTTFSKRFVTNSPSIRLVIQDGNVDELMTIMNRHGIEHKLTRIDTRHGIVRYELITNP